MKRFLTLGMGLCSYFLGAHEQPLIPLPEAYTERVVMDKRENWKSNQCLARGAK